MKRNPAASGEQEPKPRGAFEIACRYLAPRERCAVQVRAYLERHGFGADAIAETIRLLREKRFVDDFRYAQAYVEVRSQRAPRSGAWLARELFARGVDRETARRAVDEFLAGTSEEVLARRLLARMTGDAGPDLAQRAARRLRSRGFRPAIAIAWAKEQPRGTAGGVGGTDEDTEGIEGIEDNEGTVDTVDTEDTEDTEDDGE